MFQDTEGPSFVTFRWEDRYSIRPHPPETFLHDCLSWDPLLNSLMFYRREAYRLRWFFPVSSNREWFHEGPFHSPIFLCPPGAPALLSRYFLSLFSACVPFATFPVPSRKHGGLGSPLLSVAFCAGPPGSMLFVWWYLRRPWFWRPPTIGRWSCWLACSTPKTYFSKTFLSSFLWGNISVR